MPNDEGSRPFCWPSSGLGLMSVGLGLGFAVVFLWVILVQPGLCFVVRGSSGQTPGWTLPLVMVALVDTAALLAVLARRRGDRGELVRLVLWASAALGVIWTAIVVGVLLACL